MAPGFESDLVGLCVWMCWLEAGHVVVSGARPRSGTPTGKKNVSMYTGTRSRYLQDNFAVSIAWFKRNIDF